MIAHVKLDDRLSILRTGDRLRKWNSLDDQRVCSVCERKFKGRQIEIRRFPGGRYKLHCPTLGCPSGAHQWLYPRALDLSKIAEPDCATPVNNRHATKENQSRTHAVIEYDWVHS
jgi:hypothetical protein